MGKSKKNKNKTSIRLSGQNIYIDNKKRTIYYDRLTKKGYIISKKTENQALFYKNRFAILFFAAILFAGTFLTWLQSAVFFAVSILLAEYKFRKSFLKKLEVVSDIDFEKRLSPLKYIIANKEKNKVLMLSILYLLFAILVFLNAYIEGYKSALMIFSILLSVFGIYCSVLHIMAYTKME